eukprot:8296354-Pyramimonas_sp.AAC.1
MYTHELQGVLQTCRWLRDDVLSPEELHLFVYTDEGDTPGAEGPPLEDEDQVEPGERLILWIGREETENWASWAPRW